MTEHPHPQPHPHPKPKPQRQTTKPYKAWVAAALAILITFGANIVSSNPVTLRDYVYALISAIVAHQAVFWTTNPPKNGPAEPEADQPEPDPV